MTCYLTTYGIYKVCSLADHLEITEKEKGEEDDPMIKVYHEIPYMMKSKQATLLKIIILIACLLMTGTSNIANLSIISNLLADDTNIDLYLAKFLITLIFSLTMLYIVQPEKIKWIMYTVTITLMVMVVIIITDSLSIYASTPNKHTKQYTYYSFINSGIFLGVSSYAFESVSSIFNVRRTMKCRSDLPNLQISAFIFISISYYICGLAVYLAYGNFNIQDTVFKYYGVERAFMYSLGIMYSLTALFNIPFNIICFVEILESLPETRSIMCNNNGELNATKITIMRMVIIFLSMGFTLISDNFTRILDLTGSIAAPIVSYIIPIILCWEYCAITQKKIGLLGYLHDVTIIVIGICVGISGIYSTIYFNET